MSPNKSHLKLYASTYSPSQWVEHLKCSSDWDGEFDMNKWVSQAERGHGPLVLLTFQSQALLCYLHWFICNKQQKTQEIWQEFCETCPIVMVLYFQENSALRVTILGFISSEKCQSLSLQYRYSLYCSPVVNNKVFQAIWKLQIFLGLCYSEKCYLVEFLLGRKREREVRFWIMSILNVISTGRKGIKFSSLFLHSYKRKKTGCISVMCSCLKVVLF